MEELKKFWENFTYYAGQLFWPIVFLLVGIFALIFAKVGNQNQYFTWGAIAITVFGVLYLLFVLNTINRIVSMIITVILLFGTLGFAYLDYKVVKDEIEHRAKKKKIHNQVTQKLKDIRKTQKAFRKKYGHFTADWDSLVNYLKHDSILFVQIDGHVPDTLTEEEALEEGLMKKDSLYTPAGDSLFNSETARREERDYPFYIDSLPYKPGSDKKFILKAKTLKEEGGVDQPVFMAKDPDPFGDTDTLKVGSLTEATTSGNWGEY